LGILKSPAPSPRPAQGFSFNNQHPARVKTGVTVKYGTIVAQATYYSLFFL